MSGEDVEKAIARHYAAGSFDEGDELLAASEKTLPEHMVLECRGTRAFHKHELQDAVRYYEAAIGLMPHRHIARYHYLAGVQLEGRGDFVGAFKRYQGAIETEPAFVDAYVEMGALLMKVGDRTGALQCYRDAARLDPDDVGNLHNLKVVLAKLAGADSRYAEEAAAAEAAFQAAGGPEFVRRLRPA